jgi:hypothetical protein
MITLILASILAPIDLETVGTDQARGLQGRIVAASFIVGPAEGADGTVGGDQS